MIGFLAFGLTSITFSEPPTVILSNFQQLSYPLENPRYYGNVYMPEWSNGDQYVGVSFHDPVIEKRFVIIYDIQNNKTLKYDTSIKGGKSGKRGTFSKRIIPNDTHHIKWSPIDEATFYIISRVNKMDYLYRSKIKGSMSELSIIETTRYGSEEGKDVATTSPVINFSLTNPKRNRFHIFYHIGNAESIYISINEISNFSNTQKGRIRNETVIYDAQCLTLNINHFVYQGRLNDQSEIFYFTSEKMINIPEKHKNLTDTYYFNERNPRFNTSGTKIAYLRSNRIKSGKKQDDQTITYALIVYDLESLSEVVIYPNVHVTQDVFHQNPFIWFTDEEILFVENNFDKKYPLRVIHVSTGENQIVSSPFINHKDISLSNSGDKLAFIAKGEQDTKDLSFDKLFICDITVK